MPDRNCLVVVLPGIGGSVLAERGGKRKVVWGKNLPNVANVLRDPERLHIDRELEPVGLITTMTAFGIWTPVPGYERLLDRLGALPGATLDDGTPANRALDATVVGFPYDFRRSVADAAHRLDTELRERLRTLWPGEQVGQPQPRVVLVGHSMGGLVARYWATLGDDGDENWRRCRGLITLGTPHRGAPKALDVLANGIPVKVGPVSFPRIRRPIEVLRGWPGMAELLPQYPLVLDTSPGGERRFRRPEDLPVSWQPQAQAARAVHVTIGDAWDGMPRSGPDVTARIGFGSGTPRRCVWDGTKFRVTREPAGFADLADWDTDLGDGTVPAYSGLPPEMDRTNLFGVRVPLRHGPIIDLTTVADLVEGYCARRPPSAVHGDEHPVTLGLDLDELVAVGQPIGVTARVVRDVESDADLSQVEVWAECGAESVRLDWDSAARAFSGELPPEAAGLHQVHVSAEEVPDAGDLATDQTIEIVDTEELA